ncbi:MAG: hypothetical protein ACLGHL_03765 [Actinomycetota bacterium]
MSDSRTVALACAAVAVVVSLIAAYYAMWGVGGSTSALVRVPRQEPLGQYVAERHEDWDFVEAATRYDGLYYYAIAIDPLATGETHALIDAPAYRYGHPGHGWLARVFALGSVDRLPFGLLLLGLVGMAVAAYASSRLAVMFGMSPWWGLAVAANPGLIYAVTVDTPETSGAAVMALGLLAWFHRKHLLAAATFVLLCLIKEAFVFVPIGLGIWEVVRRRSDGPLPPRLTALAAGPAALAAWFLYLKSTLGQWSFTEGPENVAGPITGWLETLRLAARQGQGFEFQVGAIGLPILVAVAVFLLIGISKGFRLRSPLDAIFVLSAVLIFFLSWFALLYPKDLFRNISALVFLAPFVLGGTWLEERIPRHEMVGYRPDTD